MLRGFLKNRDHHIQSIFEIMYDDDYIDGSQYIYLVRNNDRDVWIMGDEAKSLSDEKIVDIISKHHNDFIDVPYDLFNEVAEDIYAEFVTKIVLWKESNHV